MPCPIRSCAEKSLTMPLAAQILLGSCLGALIFALIMQFGFGYQPCVLCMWQRGPYIGIALLSWLAWVLRPYGRQTAFLLVLCTACALAGMGLAIFHSGVELHWWLGTSGCAVTPLNGASPDDLRAALLHTVEARCDEISWSLFGLSMANYNIAASLALAFFSTAAAARASQN
jgi:disulfide bond formation protein DsbB